MTEGKLLGHIVSKEGTRIDPNHVESIKNLSLPNNKTQVHSFFGKVNFILRFVLDFSELTKEISAMMKNMSTFIWTK